MTPGGLGRQVGIWRRRSAGDSRDAAAIHGTSPAAAHARPAAAGRQRNFVRGGRWAGATQGSRRLVGDGRRWAAAAIGGDR